MRNNCHQFIHPDYSWEGHIPRWPSWFEISPWDLPHELQARHWLQQRPKFWQFVRHFSWKSLKLQNHCLLSSPNTEYKLNTTKNSYLQRPQWAKIIKSSLRQWSKQIPWKVSGGKEEIVSLLKYLATHHFYYSILSQISYDQNKM